MVKVDVVLHVVEYLDVVRALLYMQLGTDCDCGPTKTHCHCDCLRVNC